MQGTCHVSNRHVPSGGPSTTNRGNGCSMSTGTRRRQHTKALATASSLTWGPPDHHHQADKSSLVAGIYRSLPTTPPPQTKRPYREPGTYIASLSSSYDPMHPKTAYQDGPLSRVLLTVLCWALGLQMRREGQTVHLPWFCDYEDFVRVAKGILQHGRTPLDQEALIRRALNDSIPGGSGT